MSLFRSNKNYLGVDIGTAGIKVVELSNEHHRAKLVTYGYSEQKKESQYIDINQDPSKVTAVLKNVCQKAKITTTKCITALPNFSIFTTIISLPKLSKKELNQAIEGEAKKFIPLPLTEVILDSKILTSGKELGEKNIRVLLTGAPKNLVEKYLNIFKGAGLNLLSLETEAFALIRSLIGNDQSEIMVVNFGGLNTNIVVIEQGIPFLNRSIDVGGVTITKAITTSLNIGYERAELFKHDVGLSAGSASSAPKTIQSILESILNEIKYSLNLYRSQRDKDIEKINITGGSAMLSYLPAYLTRTLNKKVYLSDPWARIIYPEELKPVLDEIGSRMSVAVGLAMRDIV